MLVRVWSEDMGVGIFSFILFILNFGNERFYIMPVSLAKLCR